MRCGQPGEVLRMLGAANTHPEVGAVHTCRHCNTDVCTTHTTQTHTQRWAQCTHAGTVTQMYAQHTQHKHTCIHTHTHVSTRTHTRAHTHTHACTHTHAHIHMHAHTHACTHTHTHAHTSTHAHMHTHAHTHLVRWLLDRSSLSKVSIAVIPSGNLQQSRTPQPISQ